MEAKVTCMIFLVIDENGDYEVGPDYDAAIEAFENSHGGGSARRIIRIDAKVRAPETQVNEFDVPDEAGEAKRIDIEAA